MLKKFVISCLILLSLSVHADSFKVGGVLSSIELETQHGKSVKVAPNVKTILFAFEKQHSALINSYLTKQGTGFLAKHKAYYIADISGMPSLITKMFALPKMKKLPFDILLARSDKQLAFIPRKEGFATVVKVTSGKVSSLMFVNNTQQLTSAFK